MPWIAAIGAVAGGLLSSDGSGGTTTQTKDPWAAAVPWLTANLGIGQNLQQQYAQQPFNPLQQGAYANLFAGNDYVNQMMPGLLSQMSRQTGYDRNNPGRAAPYQFPGMSASSFQPMGGLLGPSMAGASQMGMLASQPPPQQPQPQAAPALPSNMFDNNGGI